jgi:acetoacetate decarboxylase
MTEEEVLESAYAMPLTSPAYPKPPFRFINMPDSSGLGSYTESGQVLPVTFKGQPGGFTHAMYLDSEAGIASGRELLGFPKVLAQPKLEVRNDALVGTLDYNGVRVATATMAYKYHPVDLEAVKKSVETPGYLLKILPHVDASPRVCELVRYRVTDVLMKGAWSGPAFTLNAHPESVSECRNRLHDESHS